jgi:hypothetical protein
MDYFPSRTPSMSEGLKKLLKHGGLKLGKPEILNLLLNVIERQTRE